MSRIVLLSVGILITAAAAAQTPVLRKGVSVPMPVTMNAVPMVDADSAGSVIVSVTFSGIVYLDVSTVTPALLSKQVKAKIEGQPGKRVYVKADARMPYSTVAKTLSALRTAGVSAPILLTSQHEPAITSYVTPTGLEVLIPPPSSDPARSATLRIGNRGVSDAELRQHLQRDRPVLLRADEGTPFGGVVHAIDVCRAEGAQVYLDAPPK